jgi:hypothetical protein
VAHALGGKNVKELERLSTALYVLRNNPALSDEDAAKRITQIKPHVTTGDAADAVQEVHRLEVAQRAVGRTTTPAT